MTPILLLSELTLDGPICAIVHLQVEPNPLALQQVIIRPDKITNGLIRFGETKGDEANCWQRLQNVEIVHILGDAIEKNDNWTVVPQRKKAA